MTRQEWLVKRHRELDAQIAELEHQRELIRAPEHKAVLTNLKKQRPALKEELTGISA